MGFIIIIVCGLIGAGSALKKKFLTCWIFLINLCFSLYLAVFLAPVVAPLLEIPGLEDGYKSAIAVGGIFLISDLVLKKVIDQIYPNSEMELKLPVFMPVFSVLSGLLSGIVIAALLIYLFMQTPLSGVVSSANNLRAASAKTIIAMVQTLNFFSGQTISQEAEIDLRKLRLLPKLKNKKPAKTDDGASAKPAGDAEAGQSEKTQDEAKSKPAKKDGGASAKPASDAEAGQSEKTPDEAKSKPAA